MQPVLDSVNLSLSSACGADCVFCPSNRGTRIRQKNMSFAIAQKIIDEMASSEYRETYNTTQMQIGENGDCFINNATIDVLRYIKKKLPNISVHVYSDVQFLTPEKVEVIMRESLLDFIGVNIDGNSPSSFHAVKRLDSHHVEQFLENFLEQREKHKAGTRLTVLSLTMRHYVDAVRAHFGKNPIRIKDPQLLELEDDFNEIKSRVKPLLRTGDQLQRATPMFWAERDLVDAKSVDYRRYQCPLLRRVIKEAFIAPDGTWYACCFDSNNDLALGNVYETSLKEVERGEARQTLITRLIKRQFELIGGPCATVNCCQYGIPEPTSLAKGDEAKGYSQA